METIKNKESKVIKGIKALETMKNKESKLIKGLIEQHGYSAKSASELVEDLYIGQYNSLADYAEEWLHEMDWENKTKVWDFVATNHLDYAGLGESLEKDGKIKSFKLTNDEEVHIFDGE